MGFIETGAAQHLRDVRISTIYEGTTGIQANDLIGRKMAREGGATIKAVIATMRRSMPNWQRNQARFFSQPSGVCDCCGRPRKRRPLDRRQLQQDVRATSVGAVPFLWLFGIVAGGWQMARGAGRTGEDRCRRQRRVLCGKIVTTRFFADHQLSRTAGLGRFGDQRRRGCAGARRIAVLSRHRFPSPHAQAGRACALRRRSIARRRSAAIQARMQRNNVGERFLAPAIASRHRCADARCNRCSPMISISPPVPMPACA